MKTAVQFTDEQAAELIKLVKARMHEIEDGYKHLDRQTWPKTSSRLADEADMLGGILSLLR